jgi:hypothetical protein
VARTHYVLDGQPGRLPTIRLDAASVTYVMTPPATPRAEALVIRCDADGELWVSLEPEPAR